MTALESLPRPPHQLFAPARLPRRAADARPVGGSPPPVPPFALRRERLEQLLDGHPERQVVLVRGPAGAGKTVLVAQWVKGAGHRCVWLTIDPTHNDRGRLLRDLMELVGQLAPGTDQPDADRSAVPGDVGLVE